MSYESVRKQLEGSLGVNPGTRTSVARNDVKKDSYGYNAVRAQLEASLGVPVSTKNPSNNPLLVYQNKATQPKIPPMDFSHVGTDALSILPGREQESSTGPFSGDRSGMSSTGRFPAKESPEIRALGAGDYGAGSGKPTGSFRPATAEDFNGAGDSPSASSAPTRKPSRSLSEARSGNLEETWEPSTGRKPKTARSLSDIRSGNVEETWMPPKKKLGGARTSVSTNSQFFGGGVTGPVTDEPVSKRPVLEGKEFHTWEEVDRYLAEQVQAGRITLEEAREERKSYTLAPASGGPAGLKKLAETADNSEPATEAAEKPVDNSSKSSAELESERAALQEEYSELNDRYLHGKINVDYTAEDVDRLVEMEKGLAKYDSDIRVAKEREASAVAGTTVWSDASKAYQELATLNQEAIKASMGDDADAERRAIARFNSALSEFNTPPESITADNIDEWAKYAYYLTLIPSDEWGKEEKKAAEEIVEILKQPTFFNGWSGKYSQALQKGNYTEWLQMQSVYTTLNAKLHPGAFSVPIGAIRGSGLLSGAKALAEWSADLSGDDSLLAGIQNYENLGSFLSDQSGFGYFAGEMAGSLALMGAIGNAARGAFALTKLPQLAQTLASGATTFATLTGINELGYAAGGEIDITKYLRDIITSGVAGAAGSGMSVSVAKLGLEFLTAFNLTSNKLANTIIAGLSGASFATGDAFIRELAGTLEYGEDYEPDTKETLKNVIIAFTFGAIQQSFSGVSSKQSESAESVAGEYKPSDPITERMQDLNSEYQKWKDWNAGKGPKPESSEFFDSSMSFAEAKKAYRSFTKIMHPDVAVSQAAADGEAALAKKIEAVSNGDAAAAAAADVELQEAVTALTEYAADPNVSVSTEFQESLQILNALLDTPAAEAPPASPASTLANAATQTGEPSAPAPASALANASEAPAAPAPRRAAKPVVEEEGKAAASALANAATGDTPKEPAAPAMKAPTTTAQNFVKGVVDDPEMSPDEKAQRILATSYHATAFEELTGIELDGTKAENKATVINWLQNGSEGASSSGDTGAPAGSSASSQAASGELNNGPEDITAEARDFYTEEQIAEMRERSMARAREGSKTEYKPAPATKDIREEKYDPTPITFEPPRSKGEYDTAAEAAIRDIRDEPLDERVEEDAAHEREWTEEDIEAVNTGKYQIGDWGEKVDEAHGYSRVATNIAEGKGSYSNLTAQERADLLNQLSTEVNPETGKPYLPDGGEWYVSKNSYGEPIVVRAKGTIRGKWDTYDPKHLGGFDFYRVSDMDPDYTLKRIPKKPQTEATEPEPAKTLSGKDKATIAQYTEKLKEDGYVFNEYTKFPDTKVTDPDLVKLQKSWKDLAKLLDGKGEYSGMSPQDRLSIFKKLYPKAEYGISHGEITFVGKGTEAIAKKLTTPLGVDIRDTKTPRASSVRTLTPQQAKNEDARRAKLRASSGEGDNGLVEWVAKRFGLNEQQAKARAAQIALNKKVARLKDEKANGYIINSRLGEPNTRIKDPKFVALQKNVSALSDFVKGVGDWSEWSARARRDMLERLFPEANWKLTHTAPGWEPNSATELGIRYTGGKSTATPDVITLEPGPKTADASDWPSSYKTEEIPDIDKLISGANIKRQNEKNPLLHRTAKSGKVDASEQKGVNQNVEKTAQSRNEGASGGTGQSAKETTKGANYVGEHSGSGASSPPEKVAKRIASYYGEDAKVTSPSSDVDHACVDVATRSGNGDVTVRLVSVKAGSSETNGTTTLDASGHISVELIAEHPAGKVGRGCTAAHEGTHVGFFTRYGLDSFSNADRIFNAFVSEVSNSSTELANFAHRVHNLMTKLHDPDRASFEFFAYMAGGDLVVKAKDTAIADTLQKETREFLVAADIVKANQYAGVPKCSTYNRAFAQASIPQSSAEYVAQQRAPGKDGRSNIDMQKQQEATEEEAYRQHRYADTHGIDNAKEGGRAIRDAQKASAAEESAKQTEDARWAAEQAYGTALGEIAKVDADLQEMFYEHDADGKRTMTYGKDQQSAGQEVRNPHARYLHELADSVSSVANGEMTIKEFADYYHRLPDDTPNTTGYFFDETVDKRLDRIKDFKMSADGQYSKADQAYIADTMTMLGRRVELGLAARASNKSAGEEFAAHAIPKAADSRFYNYWLKQARPDVLFHMMGGFDPDSTVSYGLADKAVKSTIHKINSWTAAHNYFRDAMKDVKAYTSFAHGETKIKTTIPGLGRDMSLNEALSLLRTLETNGAIEHIIKAAERLDDKHGTFFAGTEADLYSGKHNRGFRDPIRTPLLSDRALGQLSEAYTLSDSTRGKAIAAARSYAREELVALANSLRTEIAADPVARMFDEAITSAMRMLGKEGDMTYEGLFGIRMAKQGKTYWPLLIYGNDDNADILNAISSGLKNSRFLNDRTGPTGSLRILPATDVMSSYIEALTDFAAFAGLSDDLELMRKNYQGDTSLAVSVDRAFGPKTKEWLDTYINCLNGRDEKGNEFLAMLRGNLAQSALVLNAGVAIKQTPSYFNMCGAGIDPDIALKAWRPLRSSKGWAKSPIVSAMEGRTFMLASRRAGLADVDVGDLARRTRGLSTKILDKIVIAPVRNWITTNDVRTVSNVLLACQMQVERDGGFDKIGSDDYYELIARKIEEVAVKTQPIFTKQFRAEYLRDKSDLVRGLAMFRTQLTQNLNQLVDTVGEYNTAKKKGDARTVKEKKSAMRNFFVGWIASSVLYGILQSAGDALLRKDYKFKNKDGSITAGSVARRIGFNTIEAMAGTVWFADAVAKFAIDQITKVVSSSDESNLKPTQDFYGLNEGVLGLVNDIVNSTVKFIEDPSTYTGKNLAFSIAQPLGMPLRNAYNLVNAVAVTVLDAAGVNNGSTDILGWVADQFEEKTPSQLAYAAMKRVVKDYKKGKDEAADAILSSFDYSDSKVVATVKYTVRDQYAAGELTEEQARHILSEYCGLDDDGVSKVLTAAKEAQAYDAAKAKNESGFSAAETLIDAATKKEYSDSRNKSYHVMDAVLESKMSPEETDSLVTKNLDERYAQHYFAMRESGLSPEEAADFLEKVDADTNGYWKQEELVAYYRQHPELEDKIKLLFAANNPKTTWEEAKKKYKAA